MEKKINWISEADAAKLMGYQPRTLRKYCASGKLPINFTRVNYKTIEYNEYDIHKWKMDNSSILK